MSLPLKVVSSRGAESTEPYLLRVAGWTEDRYFDEAPETRLVEFEDGEIIMHSPAGTTHQEVLGFLTFLLRGYVGTRGLGRVLNGPAVARLRPGIDYEPDLFFISRALLGALGEQYFSGAPLFVIEVLSRGTRSHDLKTKAANYAAHGVREYWAVDPEARSLLRHVRSRPSSRSYETIRHRRGTISSQAVPGFWLDVSWLWQRPLPRELECLERILPSPSRGARVDRSL
jgi:Uma2 family endonuclease